ncbi:FAD-dependent oxidoreductase [Sphingomonas profundi]|uniref:oxidoreductase n=1 Tax=Alterirhizorhabdus profundi TaxID=2681549 RepID=UPI001E299881|nr:FAD-dependent oxidoreductase [Sphingomonas profundi]
MLKHVLSPIAIGPVTVPNRVARTGHGTGLGGGTMSATLIDYHAARARGGVGLTILELLAVGSSAYPFLRADGMDLIAGYRALMAAVRPHGMRVFQQIGHLGNEIPEADGSPPWSSSDSIGALVGIPAEAMSIAQIDGLVAAYRAAAQGCIDGGLDGVELHMAHGYLVQQFMSPLHNRRTDEYGGSFDNRMRLPLRLLEAVRAMLPAHMALGVRLSSEGLPGGMTPDDVATVAALFQARGLIDFLNLTLGTDYNPHKVIGAMHEPAGYEIEAGQPPRRAVSVPVLVTGRFRTLEEAEQVIAHGEADLVAMTRAHIADPDIVRKTMEGQADDVRPCIGCNHGCIGGLLTVGRIGCTVNVAVGAEATLDEALIAPAAESRRVLVVGGGPAGLEAARVAALRGHEVILAEAAAHLGGAVAIARRAPRRAGIGDIVDWLEREIFRLGVDVRLSTYVQADDVAEIAPDVLIVATGSLPRMDGTQYLSPGRIAAGMERRHVVSSHDLLLEHSNRDWGARAVVYDDVGHYEGVAAAEFLIERGTAVTFVTGRSSFAPALEPSLSADPALERLAKGDFELITYGRLTAVDEAAVTVERRYGGPSRAVEADTVVFVSHNAPNRELLDTVDDPAVRVIPVGDVRSPRFLQTAIREGHLAARGIA